MSSYSAVGNPGLKFNFAVIARIRNSRHSYVFLFDDWQGPRTYGFRDALAKAIVEREQPEHDLDVEILHVLHSESFITLVS